MFWLIILSITLVSLLGLVGGVLLLWREKLIKRASHYLVSFAVGAILVAVFADILPELLESGADIKISLLLVFAGILLFYLLEKLLIVYHCHDNDDCDVHGTSSTLLIISDTVHNFLDGMVIAGAFFVSPRLGLITALAVLAHEIPQEIGDFAVLYHNGMARGKIIFYNIVSALASVVGGVLVFAVAQRVESFSQVLLALAAGNFIYIALTDLVPITHQDKHPKSTVWHFAFLLVGASILLLLENFLPHV